VTILCHDRCSFWTSVSICREQAAGAQAAATTGGVMNEAQDRGKLLTPGEVAALFRVDPKTVTRWAAAGRISSIRTPGGHRRFREAEVRALLEGSRTVAVPAPADPVKAAIPTQSDPRSAPVHG